MIRWPVSFPAFMYICMYAYLCPLVCYLLVCRVIFSLSLHFCCRTALAANAATATDDIVVALLLLLFLLLLLLLLLPLLILLPLAIVGCHLHTTTSFAALKWIHFHLFARKCSFLTFSSSTDAGGHEFEKFEVCFFFPVWLYSRSM